SSWASSWSHSGSTPSGPPSITAQKPAPRGAAPLLRVEQPGLRWHSRLRGVPQAPNRRRWRGRREPRGAPSHPAGRNSRRDHREDQDAAARDQLGDDGHPLLLWRDAPSQGGKEPSAVRGEGPSRRAGDADPDQCGGARSADALTSAAMSIASELAKFVTGTSVALTSAAARVPRPLTWAAAAAYSQAKSHFTLPGGAR